MGFFVFLFVWLAIGFAFFRIWAFRCPPKEIQLYRSEPSVWKMRGVCGIEDGFSMSESPVWNMKNAAILSLCLGPLLFFASAFRYAWILLCKGASMIANSAIPKTKNQENPDGQKRA